jgi:hypothetical protein
MITHIYKVYIKNLCSFANRKNFKTNIIIKHVAHLVGGTEICDRKKGEKEVTLLQLRISVTLVSLKNKEIISDDTRLLLMCHHAQLSIY